MRIIDAKEAKYIVVVIYNQYEQGIAGFGSKSRAVAYYKEQLGNGWEVYLAKVESVR